MYRKIYARGVNNYSYCNIKNQKAVQWITECVETGEINMHMNKDCRAKVCTYKLSKPHGKILSYTLKKKKG